jgi:hypothetical protein
MRGRLALDLLMFGLMLAAFAYQLTGNRIHEIVGAAFVALAGSHNLLARRWYATLGHRRLRAATVLNLLLLAAALLLVASGLGNSHDLFPALRGDLFDRRTHALAAYWMLVLGAVHLGMHGPMLAHLCGGDRIAPTIRRAAMLALIGLGACAAIERDLILKLSGAYAFDYWDFSHATAGFFARYVVIAGGLASLVHLARTTLGSTKRGQP